MSEHIVNTFGIVQDFADLHGDMTTPLYEAIMGVMLSRQREEIVRCRDCRFADEDHYGAWGRTWNCERFGDVEPDGFCAWSERKAVENKCQ